MIQHSTSELARPGFAGSPDLVDHQSVSPIYFGRARRLFGWYHGTGERPRRDCGVVICNPLGYEELCAHRALRHWASSLAAAGFPTIRFDYGGTGNSGGSDTDPYRVGEWLVNIEEAATELRSRSRVLHVALLGVRLGATLALAAAPGAGADALILLAPYATGKAFAREIRALGRLMRADSDDGTPAESADTAEQVAGFTVTRETMRDLWQLDPLSRIVGVRRALVIPRDDVAVDTSVADQLAQRRVVVERAMLPGYSAMMVDAHESAAPQVVIDDSIRWLTSQYPSASVTSSARARDHDLVAGPVEGHFRESAVRFGDNRDLFGVLTEGMNRDNYCATGIILASAGSVHTVGPGRLYVELARDWAARGFSVLRMDVGGVGDSNTRDGRADNHPYPDHAVRDIESAARWMIQRGRVSRVVVAGLCAGAHASFHAGLALDGIDGILVINPIVFYWNPECALDVSTWMNYAESRRYSQSVREVSAWVRLVRGEVNVRYAAGVGYRRMREVTGSAATALWRRFSGRSTPNGGDDVVMDLKRICARGVDILLAFSEGEPGLDFVQRLHAHDMRVLERNETRFAMRVIPNADHTFTRRDARASLADILTEHLMSRHRGPSQHSR